MHQAFLTPDAIATSGSLAASGTFGCGSRGILPGISYAKASKVPAGNMAMHDHSLAKALVSNAI